MSAPCPPRRFNKSRLLLTGAFVVSVLLHVFGVSGDLIYAWWTNSQTPGQDEKLRKVTHKLAAEDWDDDTRRPDALKGIQRPERQTIWLTPKAALNAVKPAETRQPTPTPAPKRRARVATPVPHTEIAASQTASAVAAVTPPPEPLFASAPASAVASAVIASAPAPSVASLVASIPAAVAASAPAVVQASAVANGPLVRKSFPRKASITYVERNFAIPAHLSWEAANGRYKLELNIAAPFLSVIFNSEGRIDRDGLVPEHYRDMRKGKVRNEAFYNWASNTVELHDNDKISTAPITPGMQDLLSASFQFAQQGSRMKNFTMDLSNGAKLYKAVAFEMLGETTLRIAGQSVEAIKMHGAYEDRALDFWLAPQWSNLPVRMVFKMGDKSYDVIANEISIDGRSIVEPPMPGIQRPHPPGEVLNR